jgi:hypothetical protein
MKNWDAEAGQNWEKIDTFYGARTVGSFPTPTYVGELIYHSGVNQYRRWDGANWEFVGANDIFASNIKPPYESNNTLSFTGSTQKVAVLDKFTVVTNRYYLIHFAFNIEWNTNTSVGEVHIQLRAEIGGGDVSTSSAILREFAYDIDSQDVISSPISGVHSYSRGAFSSQTAQFGLFGYSDGASDWHISASAGQGGTNKGDFHFFAQDWGGD